jgi:hypothetical protein
VTTYSDGSPISFIGLPAAGAAIGDRGFVLRVAGRGAHVKWTSGDRRGHVTLEDVDDIVPFQPHTAATAATPGSALDDSLEVGVLDSLGVAHLCALRGPAAVLTAVAHTRPADLAAVADEVRTFAEQRVAATASLQQVIGQLDEEEGAELVRLAAITVMRDTFGFGDG